MSERHARDGPLVSARRVAERHVLQAKFRVVHADRLHLIPIVILGVDPEHGHDGHAVIFRHLRRQFHRRDRFEECEQGPAEQSGLLAGDDGNGLRIAQRCRCRECLGRGAAGSLLGLKQIGQRRPLPPPTASEAAEAEEPVLTVAGV